MAKSQQLMYVNSDKCITVEYIYDSLAKEYLQKGRIIRSIAGGKNTQDKMGGFVTKADLERDGFDLITSEMLMDKGARDHKWYCRNFLKILPDEKKAGQTEGGGGTRTALIPLNPTDIQLKYIEAREKEIREKGFVRLVVVKAGRLGISSIAASCLWGDVHLVNGTMGAIIAHQATATRRIFNMCKRFYEYTPVYLRPTKSYDNKTEFVFENIEFEWFSGIEVFTAGVENAARSGGYTSCLSTEVAYHKDGEARGSIVRAIQDVPGTEIVDETTANGIDGFFHGHYWQAKRGENEFTPLFFAWWESARYSKEMNQREKEELMESVHSHKQRDKYGDEETEMKLYHLSPEQLNWRRWYIRNKCQGRLIKPLDYFKQEMPGNDEEAFISTSGSVFVTNLVRLGEKNSKEPIFRGGLKYTDETKTGVKLYPDENGELIIWDMPDTEPYENEFCSGVDTQQGGYGTGDPHSLHIMSRREKVPRVVAAWHGFTETTGAFTEEMYRLHLFFKKDIMFNPERIGWGISIINEALDRKLRLMYDREEFKRTRKMNPEIVGYTPTGDAKNIIISDLNDALNNNEFECWDRNVFKEMLTFVYGQRYSNRKGFQMGAINKGGKSGRTYDDRVISMALTYKTHLLMNIGWSCRPSTKNEPEWAKKNRERADKETTWMST